METDDAYFFIIGLVALLIYCLIGIVTTKSRVKARWMGVYIVVSISLIASILLIVNDAASAWGGGGKLGIGGLLITPLIPLTVVLIVLKIRNFDDDDKNETITF